MKLGRLVRPAASAHTDFVVCGENSLDTVVRATKGGAAAGSKQSARGLLDLPGGQASTAAVACARLGWRTRYVGVIGDDFAGTVVRDGLATEDVELLVIVRQGTSTRRAVVLVDDVTGDRVIFESRDQGLNLSAGEIPDAAFTDTRMLLVDGSDPPQAIRAARAARAADVRTLVDLDHAPAHAAELLALIDVIVLPEPVVSVLAGVTDLGRGLGVIGRDSGAAAVIATLGSAGALAWCRGQELRSPAHVVEVEDSTGAGDAFRAGFAAAWLGHGGADPDLEDLLEAANLVAGLNCRSLGAQTGLPGPGDVPKRLLGRV